MTLRRPLLALFVAASLLTACDPSSFRVTTAAEPAPPAFGAQYHGLWGNWTDEERTVVLDKLAAAGATWIRMDVGWAALEEQGQGEMGQWYVDRVRRWVDEADERGLKVLATVWATPQWADKGVGVNKAPDPEEYATAARYLAGELRGRVDAWQVWNEPNLDGFYDGTATDYAALLRAAYPAFKAGDPDALVVLGGPSYNDVPWLTEVYDAGAAGSFDVMSTQPYMGPADLSPEAPDNGEIWRMTHVAAVRQLMVERGDGDLPIWFTEFGWSSHDVPAEEPWKRGVTEQQQGEYLVDAPELIRTEFPYVTNVFWYTARNRTDAGFHVNNYGLLTDELVEKPVYRAVQDYLARFPTREEGGTVPQRRASVEPWEIHIGEKVLYEGG